MNKAGLAFPNGSIEDQILGDRQRMMKVNTKRACPGTKLAVGLTKGRGRGAIVYLVSDETKHVTRAELAIDGGFLAQQGLRL